MATQLAKGGSFNDDTLTFSVEVDRDYGTGGTFVVQVLRYVADSSNQPIGQPTILVCTGTATPRFYRCTDNSPKSGRYVYRARVVHSGGTTGPVGAAWPLMKQ